MRKAASTSAMDEGENFVRDGEFHGYRRLSIVIIVTFRRLIIVSRKLSGKVVVAHLEFKLDRKAKPNSFEKFS